MQDVDGGAAKRPYIFLACPWTPMGGGMYKVVDYLVQAQRIGAGSADFKVLDTRGATLYRSVVVLLKALWRIVLGRASGRLKGIHVNMAERLSVLRKGMVVLSARAMGLPVVLHLHAAQLHHFYADLPKPLQWLTRRVFATASQVLVLGEQSRRFVVDTLGVPASKVEVVINGVPHVTTRRRPETPGKVFKVLFLGNLMERKGVSDLLKALASEPLRTRSWTADFAGGGDVAHYRALAGSLKLDQRVNFVGWADQAKAAQLLSQADVLVLPSYDEGLPLVILEALAHGVAVVCTPVGEIPAVLTIDDEVLMATPGDIDSIAEAIARLIDHPDLRRHLEAQGHQAFLKRFSMDIFFGRIAAIHQRSFDVSASDGPAQHEA